MTINAHIVVPGAVLGLIAIFGVGCGASKHATSTRALTTTATTSAGLATGAERRALGARYLVIAKAGNERLEDDFDPLEEHGRIRLARARADLSDAAATERLFDRRLLQIAFPLTTERVARLLYRVNQARASLTMVAARSTSPRQLHRYEHLLEIANAPVEQYVRTIRRQLGLPPPSTS
jgi:hypothetical protein